MFFKTIITKYITGGFASAITLYPFVLVLPQVKLRKSLVTHEKIHLQQQLETLVLPFYLIYLTEYFYHFIRTRNRHEAYSLISFEREAYAMQHDSRYLKMRKHFSWLKYSPFINWNLRFRD